MRQLIFLLYFLIISSCSTLETTSHYSNSGRAPANRVIKSCKQAIFLITHNSKRTFYKGIGKFKSRAVELYKASENGKSLHDFATQLHLGKEFGISFEQFTELFHIERIKKHIDSDKLNLKSLYDDIYINRSLSIEDTHKFLVLEVKASLNPKAVQDNQGLNSYLSSIKLMGLNQEEVFSELQRLPLFNELQGKKRNFKRTINYLSSSDGPSEYNKPIEDAISDFYLSLISKEDAYSIIEKISQDQGLPKKYELLLNFIDPRGPPKESELIRRFLLTKIHQANLPALSLPTPVKRYVNGETDYPITYGLEIEILPRKNKDIFKYYRLENFETDDWLSMSIEKRLEKFEKAYKKLNHSEIKLVALDDYKSVHHLMPDNLTVEGHGTIEISGIVMDDIDDIRDFIHQFSKRIGPGSYQGHVAYKYRPDIEGLAGYGFFEGDMAQLQALEQGSARHIFDDQSLPGKNLIHHSLGPISEQNKKDYIKIESSFKEGGKLKNSLLGRMQYGPALRRDVYPDGFAGHELRQYHNRSEELLYAMDLYSRELHHFGTLKRFQKFEEVEYTHEDLPVDRALEYDINIDDKAWVQFFRSIASYAKKNYSKNTMYGAAPIRERFLFPLRDWKNHKIFENLGAMEKKELHERIDKATLTYIEKINDLVENKPDSDEEIFKLLRIFMSDWARETRLSPHFEKYRYANLNKENLNKLHMYRLNSHEKADNQYQTTNVHVLKNGVSVPVLKEADIENKNLNYSELLKNSVEVIYKDNQPFGHIGVRIGEDYHSFNYVKSISIQAFKPSYGGVKKTGYLFKVPKERLELLKGKVQELMSNSSTFNIPPYDSWSSRLEIIDDNGILKYKSPAESDNPKYANNTHINGEIIEEDDKFFLVSPNGYKHPVRKINDRFYTDSYSCATGVIKLMNDILEMSHSSFHSAKSFKEKLEEVGYNGLVPDFIVDY